MEDNIPSEEREVAFFYGVPVTINPLESPVYEGYTFSPAPGLTIIQHTEAVKRLFMLTSAMNAHFPDQEAMHRAAEQVCRQWWWDDVRRAGPDGFFRPARG